MPDAIGQVPSRHAASEPLLLVGAKHSYSYQANSPLALEKLYARSHEWVDVSADKTTGMPSHSLILPDSNSFKTPA